MWMCQSVIELYVDWRAPLVRTYDQRVSDTDDQFLTEASHEALWYLAEGI